MSLLPEPDGGSTQFNAVSAQQQCRSDRLRARCRSQSGATDPTADIFELRGIDCGGAVVVMRPDQYVAKRAAPDRDGGTQAFFAPLLPT